MLGFDGFGPEKVLIVHNPKIGLRGFVVIDNTALGPGKGGIRLTKTVTVEEVAKLARAMTWKNALADIPFGGAKAGIVADTDVPSKERKAELVQAFAQAIKPLVPEHYIAGPDMNITQEEMRIFAETMGDNKACTGKPKELGGLPHELGSTGFGVFHATGVAVDFLEMDLNNAKVAIEGFGNVGSFAGKFLSEAGAKLVGVSDIKGLVYNENGLDYERLIEARDKKGSVIAYAGEKQILPNHDIIKLDVDILVTAAIPNLIQAHEVDLVKAKLIVEGSNIPMTQEVEEMLAQRGVLIIPDFVANAGGVISSYVEYIGGTEQEMFKLVKEKITKNTKLVIERASDTLHTRAAALAIARERVLKKCKWCIDN
ncbi:MAG: Glu/Leu/Phe/Val dehydrogenase [Candidatus Diapherotrites archaeon]|nr:Glu/Leu/Phe/Val dehydrogenase [Candidatus Diapherotrites archaeon]